MDRFMYAAKTAFYCTIYCVLCILEWTFNLILFGLVWILQWPIMLTVIVCGSIWSRNPWRKERPLEKFMREYLEAARIEAELDAELLQLHHEADELEQMVKRHL